MSIELSRIGNFIYYFFIDDNYKINYELGLADITQDFIMRYRRIIGIVILIILLGIMKNCNWNYNKSQLKLEESNTKQIWNGRGGSFMAAAPIASALGSTGATAALTSGAAASAGGSSGAVAALTSGVGTSIGSNIAQNLAKNAVSDNKTTDVKKSIKTKLMNSATGGKYSSMRDAGMSRFGSGLELTRQGGQFAADKFKEFAGWLYEILFAIAISIAICMIVVPSIAFFALGLICYFLLRKKISTMKAF